MNNLCYNCFSTRGEYDVCPYCGYVNTATNTDGYILQPGSKVWGRYIIGTVLGMGGFGITYRAWDSRLSSMVAIKEFFPQSLVSRIPGEMKVRVFSGDKQEGYKSHLTKFMDEAKNLAKFTKEKHIVNVLDFFEDNGTAYIVMEFLDGVTLKEHLINSGGRLSVQQAIAFESDLLMALSAIHEKGIIHRDISPDNIFITGDGNLKVLDFGAARFALEEGSDLSQSVVVKKGYAPPEQYRKNMKQGRWTDIYAAGATLYKMVTGITPDESIERAEKDTLKRPSQTGTLLDAAVDKTVMKSMALKPELRFKSAEAMLAALENRTSFDFPEEELKKRKKRNLALIFGSIAAVVIAVAVLIPTTISPPSAPTATDGMSGEVNTSNGQVAQGDAPVQDTNVQSGVPEVEMPEKSVAQAPPIDFDSIQPTQITLQVDYKTVWDNDTQENVLTENPVFQELERGFEAKYPGFDVVLVHSTWEERDADDYSAQFVSADAPTVFHDSGLSNDEQPHRADLTALYNSLDIENYYALDYFADGTASNSDKGELNYMPVSFVVSHLMYNEQAVAELGIEMPEALTDIQFLFDVAEQHPGIVNVEQYDIFNLIESTRPDIALNRDYDALYSIMEQYMNLVNNSDYLDSIISHDKSYTNVLYWRGTERDANAGIPVLNNGYIDDYNFTSYSVSSYVGENEQKAGMLLIYYMLSEEGQRILTTSGDHYVSLDQPLHRAVLPEYTQMYPSVSFLIEEDYSDRIRRLKDDDVYLQGFYDLFDGMRNPSTESVLQLVEEQYGYWKDDKQSAAE